MSITTIEKTVPSHPHWKNIGIKHHHGICIPLFSLHSKKSCGIGEFPDLLPIIEWCKSLQLDVIQLLPLNDTGLDRSPYNPISTIALNPLHLGLASLPNIEKYPHLIKELQSQQNQTAQQRVNYTSVREKKYHWLIKYFQAEFPQASRTKAYRSFIKNHENLKHYALFKALKNRFGWSSWKTWPEPIQNRDPEIIQELEEHLKEDIYFHLFIQYLCYEQLSHVKKEASKQGVFLMGDFPILISSESADIWQNTHLFHEDFSAGAPPDVYCETGQNWGFPTFNWEALKKDNYRWWKNRLSVGSQFYHLYRIDHIVGLFRLWSIPLGKEGSDGFFSPEAPDAWIPHGENILKMLLEASPLLPIGEDLGNVPDEVRVKMKEMGISGTKVMRWEKDWHNNEKIIPHTEYPPLSLSTVSTHDSEPLQLWWEKFPEEAEKFSAYYNWKYEKKLLKPFHLKLLQESHSSSSLFHINLLQEYLSMVEPLSWNNPEEERVNTPGTVSDHNWSICFRASVEEIIQNQELKEVFYACLKNVTPSTTKGANKPSCRRRRK